MPLSFFPKGEASFRPGSSGDPPSEQVWPRSEGAAHRHRLLTVKHSPAVLGGGGQGQAGVVKLVPIVANADLELDGAINVLQHGGRVEGSEEAELAPAEELLRTEEVQEQDS